MLTLNRKEGESIILTNEGLKIQILLKEAINGKASISIDAPEDVLILREEIDESLL